MPSTFFSLFSLFASCAFAASRVTPPAGALVVGSSGTFKTIQAAVDNLSTTATAAQSIFIQPGTYSEQVVIPARKAQLTIYGSSSNTDSYSGNTVTITAKKSQKDGLTNDGTGTLRVLADNFRLYNVDVVNAYGQGSQAIALSSQGSHDSYYGCSFTGFQDTLLSEGSAFYGNCEITGATDFIFGQKGVGWFESCDIKVLSASVGYVTASGRTSASGTNYYVIDKSTISAASGNSVKAGAYYLGRPWGAYARVTVQSTSMTNVINSAGWSIWNSGDERTDNVSFQEYGNTGAGASGKRASFSSEANAAVSISSVLGSTSWIDSAFL